MGNLARLVGGAIKMIRRCIEGKENCLICAMRGKNTPSKIAVESVNGYLPACEEHGLQAEKMGWAVIKHMPGEGGK